ncbi:hypothetical protein FORC14_1914 [Vibrio parahaemolyticus]|nr:hypothetical protein FORC14_1914 [Vibrio parahaemolyticus]
MKISFSVSAAFHAWFLKLEFAFDRSNSSQAEAEEA